MEEKILQQYDAHVKDYQRHLLIQILDSAKSKAMQQLLEEKTPLPKERINVPRPQTEMPSISMDLPIGVGKDQNIIPRGLFAPKMVSIPDIIPNLELLSNISVCKVQPQEYAIKTDAKIHTEIFGDIPTGKIDVPNSDFDFTPKISGINDTISLPAVPEISHALSYNPQIEKDTFDIHLPELAVTDNSIDTTINISEINGTENIISTKESINRTISQVNEPLNLSLPSIDLEHIEGLKADVTLPQSVGQLTSKTPQIRIEQPSVNLPREVELPEISVQLNISKEIDNYLNIHLPSKLSLSGFTPSLDGQIFDSVRTRLPMDIDKFHQPMKDIRFTALETQQMTIPIIKVRLPKMDDILALL